MNEPLLQPQIYVVCVDQNDYVMPTHNQWLDVTQPLEVLEQSINQLVANAKPFAQEWCITDSKDLGYGLNFESLAVIHERALFIQKHGHAFLAACLISYDLEMAKERFEYDYQGAYKSQVDFASVHFRACYGSNIPVEAWSHITVDYESFEQALFSCRENEEAASYRALALEGSVHVFRMQCIDGEWM